MSNQLKEIWEQLSIFFVKYVPFYALVAIFIKISVEVKRKTATWAGSILSLIIGVGVGSLFNPLIRAHTSENVYPIAIGAIAILGEKIAEYLMYKFKVDLVLAVISKEIVEWIKSKVNK